MCYNNVRHVMLTIRGANRNNMVYHYYLHALQKGFFMRYIMINVEKVFADAFPSPHLLLLTPVFKSFNALEGACLTRHAQLALTAVIFL